ncbi:hypothetical protein Tco_0351878 [Tanacetum coccineum]
MDLSVTFKVGDTRLSPTISLNRLNRVDVMTLLVSYMLERLARNEYYCFLDGFSGYFQIPIDPLDQEKTTFTCPYGTFAYRRMPFGLCNAPEVPKGVWLQSFTDMMRKPWKSSCMISRSFGDSSPPVLSHLEQQCSKV